MEFTGVPGRQKTLDKALCRSTISTVYYRQYSCTVSYTSGYKRSTRGGVMQLFVTRSCFAFALAVSVSAGALAQGQQSKDPMMGTWKLNLVKSTYDPGPKPTRDVIVKFEAVGGDGIKTSIDT